LHNPFADDKAERMPDPEQLAREEIDRQLVLAGWVVQDRKDLNLFAGPGVAIREVSIPGAGEADYLLVAKGKAVGIVEAKKRGDTLTGVEMKTRVYAEQLPPHMPVWALPLPMLYESTGIETRFTNLLEPEPRSRRTFGFHRPETLAAWAKEAASSEIAGRSAAEEPPTWDTGQSTLAGRLRNLPPDLTDPNLWPAQREAITNLETSLRENRPRALIQMATGSGKTVTAISSIYRLIKHARAKRVLFLVDRANLGKQTATEFQQYVAPDDGRKFSEIYVVQHLRSNKIDDTAKVCISTVQRLYSILAGEEELDESLEEGSQFETESRFAAPKPIAYNPNVPIETFDIIFIDEAHRSIFNLWRQVLEYFDAYLIGLTATPNKQALGFFNQNLVMEYGHEQAVADKVNVPFDVYPIRTRITTEGATVEAGYQLEYRDKPTRAQRWAELDEDLTYTAQQLDRDVVSMDQIRTVVRTFRDKLFTEIFPGRSEVPKTLIFAKDDTHADDIVQIVREEFAKGNDFCQKITYRTSGIKPEELLAQFRNNYNPRIVVTVDMIATGTDVKPIEIVMFMRTVKSRGYFEQMKGRGVRVMPADDLRRVTKDAPAKTHFVIVDAVGLAETEMIDAGPPLERKRSVSFVRLLETVGWGHADRDTLSSLAFRLSRLDKELPAEGQAQIERVSGGQSLRAIVAGLMEALDPDRQLACAQAATGLGPDGQPDETALEAAREELLVEAARSLAGNPDLRNLLVGLQARAEQAIDHVSQDEVIEAGFSAEATERARATIGSFQQFIEENRDELLAIQIYLNQPYGSGLRFRDVRELADRIQAPPYSLSVDGLWQAYAQVDRSKVRGSGRRVLADIVSLIRFETGRDEELTPFAERVRERFAEWLAAQEAARGPFSPEQRRMLELIRDHIAGSAAIEKEDLDEVPFNQHGGRIRVYELFGDGYTQLLDELNEALAA
jgi:type I restriction enzyme R subunit